MSAIFLRRYPLTALLLSLLLAWPASAQEQAAPRKMFAPIDEPKDELQKLEYVLNFWGAQTWADIVEWEWFKNIGEPEKSALKAAAARTLVSQEAVAQELILQAETLKAHNRSLSDKLLVLAALIGVFDETELERIAKFGEGSFKKEAKAILTVSNAVGKNYPEALADLAVPLPDISAYKGQPVVIMLWAPSSIQFQQAWPAAREELVRLVNSGYALVGVSLDAAPDQAKKFVEAEPIKWHSVHAARQSIRDYTGRRFPTFWIVDRNGILVTTDAELQTLGN